MDLHVDAIEVLAISNPTDQTIGIVLLPSRNMLHISLSLSQTLYSLPIYKCKHINLGIICCIHHENIIYGDSHNLSLISFHIYLVKH
jgi:hypothetical protein